MEIKGFITHKLAETYDDCQDYFAVNINEKKVAISDGMSQSIFPQWWAEELVSAYLNNNWSPNQENLNERRSNWRKKVEEYLKKRQEKGEPTWMLENCLSEKQGAGATFCGIQFHEYKWDGYVLGDSCLIEIAADNTIKAIHRSEEGDFSNHPDYFESIQGGKGTPKRIEGELHKDCKILLVTDPFAEFLYKKKINGHEKEYIENLLEIDSHQTFCDLVEKWRNYEELHNDDSTLIVIKHNNTITFSEKCIDKLSELCKKSQDPINSLIEENPEMYRKQSGIDLLMKISYFIKNSRMNKHVKNKLLEFIDKQKNDLANG